MEEYLKNITLFAGFVKSIYAAFIVADFTPEQSMELTKVLMLHFLKEGSIDGEL